MRGQPDELTRLEAFDGDFSIENDTVRELEEFLTGQFTYDESYNEICVEYPTGNKMQIGFLYPGNKSPRMIDVLLTPDEQAKFPACFEIEGGRIYFHWQRCPF